MTDVDAEQVSGTVGASQPGGVVGASQVGGTVGARLAAPQANLWTPAQLGDDLALWLDVWDSDFDLRTDGGTDYVERWGDLSQYNRHNSQSTASNQPFLQANTVSFQGSGDVLFNAAYTPPPELTVVGLAVPRGNNSVVVSQADFSVDERSWFLRAYYEGSAAAFSYSDRTLGSSFTTDIQNTSLDTHLLLSGEYTESSIELFKNGAGDGAESLNQWERFEQELAVGEYTEDDASGAIDITVVVLMSKQDEPVRQKIEGWLAHKADRNGISAPLQNLPSDHPYADNPPTL